MKQATAKAVPQHDEIRMGSEYATARDYLARPRKPGPKPLAGKPKPEPQHGSNDSDFGFADQRAE